MLDQKFGWNAYSDDAIFFNNLTLVTVATSFGMIFGGYLGGYLLPRYGSRRIIIVVNTISLVMNIIKLLENTVAIMVSRLILGLCVGISTVCLGRAINDTVPAKNIALYGAFVNAGYGIGIALSNLMGLMIPLNNGEEGDLQKMKDDENWRVVFGVPIILEVYTLIVLLFIIKHESIIKLL